MNETERPAHADRLPYVEVVWDNRQKRRKFVGDMSREAAERFVRKHNLWDVTFESGYDYV